MRARAQRRRGDSFRGSASKTRSDDRAFADHGGAALRDVAPVQEELVVQVRRHAKLPVGRDRGGEAPRATGAAARRTRARCARIARRLLAPHEHRRGRRLRGGERRIRGIEVPLPDGAQPDPARFMRRIVSQLDVFANRDARRGAASSSRAPAPRTPIAPRSDPPASIIIPPPTAATPGRWRMPSPGARAAKLPRARWY